MPKKKKGQSHSKRPISRRSPVWCRYTMEEVEALVVKLARDGNNPSRIGIVLRDQHGIPLAKSLVGKNIVEILKKNDLEPEIPEDLSSLLVKAARLRAHLERNRSDKYNRRAVQTIESRIRSLSRYYKRKGIIPKDWIYIPTSFVVA